MFFAHKIRSIAPGARVLEIGPGGTPHPRADVFLERRFPDDEAHRQRGYTAPLMTSKPVVYYDGDSFPFADHEFDYVICSHVIEHVPDVEGFMQEIFRVGKGGYLEYPTIYYEYLYDFPEHISFLRWSGEALMFLPKSNTAFEEFSSVRRLYFRTLVQGHADLIDDLLPFMIEGFEWRKPFPVRKATSVAEFAVRDEELLKIPRKRRLLTRAANKLSRMFGRYFLGKGSA